MQRRSEEAAIMKESSLPTAFGTPNDVRLFPTTGSAPTASTRSIPIASSERSVVEIQQDEEEALAEFRDQAMYRRILQGMKVEDMPMITARRPACGSFSPSCSWRS